MPAQPGGPTIRRRLDSSEPLVHEFRILADSPERAEQLARALISAYDNHVQSQRSDHKDSLKEHEVRLPELNLAFEKAQQQYDELSQQLKNLEPIPPQVYEELKTKEWTLRVEMAGVEGRLKAAKKLTSSPAPSRAGGGGRGAGYPGPKKPTLSRDPSADVWWIAGTTTPENHKLIAQVAERISITSQIELAGLLEQLNKIDEFLNTYRHYAQLTAKKKSASLVLDKASRKKRSTEQGIESLKKSLKEDLVPFELTEPVQIRPIEWTKASAPEPGPSRGPSRTR